MGDAETVIAFDTSESQNRLLSAALSDKAIDMEARLTLCDMPSEATTMARLFELSEDGCCLRLRSEQGELFAIGAEVVIEAQGFRISGCVISARDDERCIIFGLGDNEAIEAVRACLHPHELH
ncbi:MAG: hypothetical protein MJE77_10195 [Proteobacteria bacterium]|nr:hypothetical protein [Pseudomonadota bacterium]